MLTILVGLPGSGKSTYAVNLQKKTPGMKRYEDFLGVPRCLDEDRGLFFLLDDVRSGRPVVADDVFLCRMHDRTIFETVLRPFVPDGYSVRWIYFSNSPAICRKNVEHRNRRKPSDARFRDAIHWVENLTSLYLIPPGIKPVEVAEHQS